MKELENGMAIHCKTKDEARTLAQYYGMGQDMVGYWDQYKEETCYFYEPDSWTSSRAWTYQNRAWALQNPDKFTLVEFGDLLEPDKPKNLPRQNYITCTLNDGTVLDFGGWCNKVGSWVRNDEFVKFFSENPEPPFYEATLALIPAREIRRIDFYTSDEMLQKTLIKKEESKESEGTNE